MIRYKIKNVINLLLIVGFVSCNDPKEIKHFNTYATALEYAKVNDRKLLIFFTGYAWQDLRLQKLLFLDSAISKSLKENNTDSNDQYRRSCKWQSGSIIIASIV
jgi:hypothetical protein